MVEKELPSERQSSSERIDTKTMYLIRDENGTAQLVFNRPHIRNAINKQGIDDFASLVDNVAKDTTTCVLTIRGEGKGFCSGIDLNYLTSEEIDLEFFRQWETTLRTLETMDKIVISGMHGFAISGGVQIGLASDIRVASDDLILRIEKEPIVTGLTSFRLPRLIGEGRAKRLLLSGMELTAQEAFSMGLVDYVFPAEKFKTELEAVAQKASHGTTAATFFTKQLIAESSDESYRIFQASYIEKQKAALNSADLAAFKAQYLEERKRKKKI